LQYLQRRERNVARGLRRERTNRRRHQTGKDYVVKEESATAIAAALDCTIDRRAAGACSECVDNLVENEERDHDHGNLKPKLHVQASTDKTLMNTGARRDIATMMSMPGVGGRLEVGNAWEEAVKNNE
jgi:hypothetical protein